MKRFEVGDNVRAIEDDNSTHNAAPGTLGKIVSIDGAGDGFLDGIVVLWETMDENANRSGYSDDSKCSSWVYATAIEKVD